MESAKSQICPECGLYIKGKSIMLDHIEKQSKKTYMCSKCGKHLKSARMHYFHSRNLLSDKLSCNQCSKSFQTKQRLTSHVDFEHLKKQYKGKYCDKEFSRADTLRVHSKCHGMKTNLFSCLYPECDKQYQNWRSI